MANERLGMTKVRQIIRLWHEGISRRNIADALGISRDSARKYVALFEMSGLGYSDVEQMTNIELNRIFDNESIPDDSNLEKLINSLKKL